MALGWGVDGVSFFSFFFQTNIYVLSKIAEIYSLGVYFNPAQLITPC